MPKAEQKRTPWKWSEKKHEAAQLIAADELTDQEIADKVDIKRQTLWEWKKREEFAARIKEIEDSLGALASRYALARRGRRLQAQGVRWNKLHQVIDERAADERMEGVPGGRTGLLVIEESEVALIPAGDGVGPPHPVAVPTKVAVDTATLKEIRELEKHVAVEVGQWTEKREHSTPELDALIAAALGQLAAGREEEVAGKASGAGEGEAEARASGH